MRRRHQVKSLISLSSPHLSLATLTLLPDRRAAVDACSGDCRRCHGCLPSGAPSPLSCSPCVCDPQAVVSAVSRTLRRRPSPPTAAEDPDLLPSDQPSLSASPLSLSLQAEIGIDALRRREPAIDRTPAVDFAATAYPEILSSSPSDAVEPRCHDLIVVPRAAALVSNASPTVSVEPPSSPLPAVERRRRRRGGKGVPPEPAVVCCRLRPPLYRRSVVAIPSRDFPTTLPISISVKPGFPSPIAHVDVVYNRCASLVFCDCRLRRGRPLILFRRYR